MDDSALLFVAIGIMLVQLGAPILAWVVEALTPTPDRMSMNYEPPKVSRHFRFDWQFAIDMSRLPLLRSASLVIGFMPLMTEASTALFDFQIVNVPTSLWILWWSSVAFIASWVLLKLRCPHLIQQYRHYGEYREQQHSHRWIGWLFYNTITRLTSWQVIVHETLEKGISIRTTDAGSPLEYRVCPYLVKNDASSEAEPFKEPTQRNTVRVFYPLNIDRDLYVPLHCDGERWILLLREDDPKLRQKEQELFWILFTQAAKEAPVSRIGFWVFFYLSVLLLAINVLKHVYVVITG